MRLLRNLLLVPLIAAPANAASLPSWDMRKFCIAQRAPDITDCVQLQNDARDRLKGSWSQYTAEEQADCISYVADDDEVLPSYKRVEDCLALAVKDR